LGNVALDDSGVLDLQSGIFKISGGYSPQASSTLSLILGGVTPGTGFAQLQVVGTAKLTGALAVTLNPGFTPKPGDTFQIITYGAGSGTFSTLTGISPGNPPVYLPTGVNLVANGAGVLNVDPAAAGQSAGRFRLRVSGLTGRTFVIEASTDLSTWSPVVTHSREADASGEVIEADVGAVPQCFFRVRVAQ
jgi:hypothetical protein